MQCVMMIISMMMARIEIDTEDDDDDDVEKDVNWKAIMSW